MEEPDKDNGGVFNEGEAVIEKVLVPSSFFFGIEKHEDIDHTWKMSNSNLEVL